MGLNLTEKKIKFAKNGQKIPLLNFFYGYFAPPPPVVTKPKVTTYIHRLVVFPISVCPIGRARPLENDTHSTILETWARTMRPQSSLCTITSCCGSRSATVNGYDSHAALPHSASLARKLCLSASAKQKGEFSHKHN